MKANRNVPDPCPRLHRRHRPDLADAATLSLD
jgi:hypothetical protein